MKELSTAIVTDSDALWRLETEWWSLWRAARAATPFQSPAWLIPWWATFGPGELFTVAVRQGERLVGLAPFYIEHGGLGRRILPIGISLSDYLDVLLDPDFEGLAGAAIVSAVAGEAARWDGWDLEELRPQAAALSLPCPAGCSEAAGDQTACPVLALAGEGASSVPAGKRRKLRMAQNRAARRGGAVFAPQAEAAPAFLDDLFRLHGARWEGRGEAGVLADAAVRRFHERALPRLLAAGLARLYGLRIDGQVVGAYYGFLERGAAYAYLGGFDPAFAFEGPGTILFGHAVAQARREGATEMHFLRGQEAYKYQWGAVDRWNRRRSFRRLPRA